MIYDNAGLIFKLKYGLVKQNKNYDNSSNPNVSAYGSFSFYIHFSETVTVSVLEMSLGF